MRKQNPPTGPSATGPGRDDAPVVERGDRNRATRQARVTDSPGPGSDGIPPAPTEPPPTPVALPPEPHRPHDDVEPYGTSVLPVRVVGKSAPPAPSGPPASRTPAPRTATARKSTRRTAVHAEPLLDRDTGDELQARFRETLVAFVDGPSDAVSDADEVAAQIAKSAVDAIQVRRAELDQIRRAAGDDTEQLRLALHKYRAFVQAMLKL
ncbi:hypothetical protein [Embleya sp. AB8]|uniref:hypothetical protein n=1 Tax=Embleya sp. AB8 TaxID=3156304 RepID=UPI003C718B35